MIIPLIQPSAEYNLCLETLLSSLCCLTEGPEAIERCRAEEFGLASILEETIKARQDKDECKEIVEYSQTLLKKIFVSEKDSEITDR